MAVVRSSLCLSVRSSRPFVTCLSLLRERKVPLSSHWCTWSADITCLISCHFEVTGSKWPSQGSGTKCAISLTDRRMVLSIDSNAIIRLSIACFVTKLFAIKSQTRLEELRPKLDRFLDLLLFFGGNSPKIYMAFLLIYSVPFARFGWVPFADLRVRSLAMKQNTEFTTGE